MKRLIFKNANLLDTRSDRLVSVDIVTENGKIVSFDSADFEGETIDLEGGIVFGGFVNNFCDSEAAFRENYFDFPSQKLQYVQQLFEIKNILAGVTRSFDISNGGGVLIENVEEKDEKTLSDLRNLAKGKKTFLRFGQDLFSLGKIDQFFGKSAPMVLEDFGFLDENPIILGGNCLEKDDFEILSRYSCSFLLSPNEDSKNGRRKINILSLVKNRFPLGLASGTFAEIDFFSFMRQIIFDTRSLFENENLISEKEAFLLATSGVTVKENRLEKSGEASFVVIKNEKSLYSSIYENLVWEKNNSDIVLTVKNGEILQKNGKILMKNLPTYDKIKENINS